MNEIFDFLVSTYWGGSIWIVAGVLLILRTIKNPSLPEKAWLAGDIKGYGGGVGAILLGITVIIGKLLGKL